MKKTFFIIVVFFATNLHAQEKLLLCSVVLPDGKERAYSFSLDQEKMILYLTEESQELKIVKYNPVQLWASSDKKINRNFEYDQQTFYFNRVSGALKISYFRKQTEEEIAECSERLDILTNTELKCDSDIVLMGKDENGHCSVVKQKF